MIRAGLERRMGTRLLGLMLIHFVVTAEAQSIKLDRETQGSAHHFDESERYLITCGRGVYGRIHVTSCETAKLLHTLNWSDARWSTHLLVDGSHLIVSFVTADNPAKSVVAVFQMEDVIKGPDAEPIATIDETAIPEFGFWGSPLMSLRDETLLFGRYEGTILPVSPSSHSAVSGFSLRTGRTTELAQDALNAGLPREKDTAPKNGGFGVGTASPYGFDLNRFALFEEFRETDDGNVEVFRLRANTKLLKTKVDHILIDWSYQPTARVHSSMVVPLLPRTISPDGATYTATWLSVREPKANQDYTASIMLGKLEDGFKREQLKRVRLLRHEGSRDFNPSRIFVTWTADGSHFFVNDVYPSRKPRQCFVTMHSADGRVVQRFPLHAGSCSVKAVSKSGRYFITQAGEGRLKKQAVRLWKSGQRKAVVSH